MARRILSEKQIVFHYSSLYEKVYILYNYSVLTIDESFTTSLYAIMHIYIDITTHSRNEWILLLLYCLVTVHLIVVQYDRNAWKSRVFHLFFIPVTVVPITVNKQDNDNYVSSISLSTNLYISLRTRTFHYLDYITLLTTYR